MIHSSTIIFFSKDIFVTQQTALHEEMFWTVQVLPEVWLLSWNCHSFLTSLLKMNRNLKILSYLKRTQFICDLALKWTIGNAIALCVNFYSLIVTMVNMHFTMTLNMHGMICWDYNCIYELSFSSKTNSFPNF